MNADNAFFLFVNFVILETLYFMFTQLFTILPLTCAIFVLLFGVFILSKDRTSPMNRLMFGFSLSMFFWMFGTFMMFGLRGENRELALFWDRFVYAGVVFMPPFMHHFSLIFTKNKGQRKLLTINYLFAFFFLLISRTPYFVDDLNIYNWGAHSQARLFHHIFLFYFFIGTGIFFKNLFSEYRTIFNKERKIQIIYAFVAFAIVIFVGGSAYLYAYGIDTKFPFAYVSGLIFPVLLSYAISRHGLMHIRIVAAEILVGLVNFFIVIEIFLARSVSELVIRILVAAIVTVINVLLMISVQREIKRKDEITKLAKSLEQANLRLQELDRQKTEFLSIASHQLRTPLSIIKGYIELITDGAYGKVKPKTKAILADMDSSNERLVKLVDEFLDITRIEQGRTKFSFGMHDMNELVSSVVKELTDRAKDKKLKLVWKAGKTKEDVYMDDEKVRHVVFNYVDNAIKYTPKGKVTVTLEHGNNGVILKVTDTGIGFEKIDEVNFFQKFYRGKNVEGTNVNGTGLGIYVCRKFMEAQDGRVWATSPGAGKGSEFGFWLPQKTGEKPKVVQQDELAGVPHEIIEKKDTSTLASVV